MAPKRRALYHSRSVELNQFPYNQHHGQQFGASVVRPLSCMGQALAGKVKAPRNKQEAHVKGEMKDNHHSVASHNSGRYTMSRPTQIRMPNIPIVPSSGPQGVWTAVLIITKYNYVLQSLDF